MRITNKITLNFFINITVLILPFTVTASEVWWSPTFKKMLASDLSITTKDEAKKRFEHYKIESDPSVTNPELNRITGCAKILKLDPLSLDLNRLAEQDYREAFKECRLLETFIQAKPAKVSSLNNYHFTKISLRELPACMGTEDGEPDYVEMMEKAQALTESWGDTDTTKIIRVLSPDEMIISYEGPDKSDNMDDNDKFKVTLLGKGDFTGSGQEQIAVYVQGIGTYPRDYKRYDVYLLGRKPNDLLFRNLAVRDSCEHPNWNAPAPICSAPRVNKLRSQIQTLYKDKKYQEALQLGDKFLKGCGGKILDGPKAWLLNDLALIEHKLGDNKKCLKKLKEASNLYQLSPKLIKATQTNTKLCESAQVKK